MNDNNVYEKVDITGKIISAAFEVHNELGAHYMEVVYQRALAKELMSTGLEYNREVEVPIHYKGEKIDTRRADFLVEGCLVEIKAKNELEDRDYEQLLFYMKSGGFRVGLLLNFGAKKLQIKRMAYSKGTI